MTPTTTMTAAAVMVGSWQTIVLTKLYGNEKELEFRFCTHEVSIFFGFQQIEKKHLYTPNKSHNFLLLDCALENELVSIFQSLHLFFIQFFSLSCHLFIIVTLLLSLSLPLPLSVYRTFNPSIYIWIDSHLIYFSSYFINSIWIIYRVFFFFTSCCCHISLNLKWNLSHFS